MKDAINDHDMDGLNRYLDDLMDADERSAFEQRLAESGPLAELHRQHQDVVAQLGQAFSPDDVAARHAVAAIMGRIDADAEGDDQADSTSADRAADRVADAPGAEPMEPAEPTDHDVQAGEDPYAPIGSVGATPWWRQALAVAACITIATTVLFAGQRLSPFGAPAAPDATELYAQLVDSGFVAPSFCSPERFTDEMQQRTGQPLLLAALNPGIDLLGWSYPYVYGDPVIDHDELVLMARVEDQPVIVLLHADAASAPKNQPGVFVHHRRLGSLEGYEVGPFETPRLISLLSTP